MTGTSPVHERSFSFGLVLDATGIRMTLDDRRTYGRRAYLSLPHGIMLQHIPEGVSVGSLRRWRPTAGPPTSQSKRSFLRRGGGMGHRAHAAVAVPTGCKSASR